VNTAVAQQARTADFVRLESVRKCYDSAPLGEVALAGVTLSLAEGSFTAVVGPAGSGKSSFLRCAAGLTRPTTGSVMLDGVKLGELDDAELTALRRERIGFLTADEKALEQVGVAELAHHRTEELTAAQRQRVALARALVVDPLVIFADEPVRDLDAAAAGDFLRLLRATGRTVVLTTADPGVAGQADETVHLDGGRIAAA
jgi:putative ABC transport system ATP-binding protein